MAVLTSQTNAQTTTTVSKKCGKCQKPVSSSSKVGDTCPHCGVRWGYENTTTSSTTVNRPSYNNYIDIYSPSSTRVNNTSTKTTQNNPPAKPNPFASYSKQMTEQWLMERLKSYARKRVYCSDDPILRIGGCTTYDDYEFKFEGDYLIVKYNYNNDHDEIVYVPIYDFNYAYGKSYGSDFSISTNSNTMYEVNKKYDTKRVTNFLSIGFKNDSETDLIENIEFAFKQLKKYHRKPTSNLLPQFTSASEENRPTKETTQSWLISKLNAYSKTSSSFSLDYSSATSNYSFSFSGDFLVITCEESSTLKSQYGNVDSKTKYTYYVPICDASFDRASSGPYDKTITCKFNSYKNPIIRQTNNGSRTTVNDVGLNIDLYKENDLFDRMKKAIKNLKSFCPNSIKTNEPF